jgi:hypothetical protein
MRMSRKIRKTNMSSLELKGMQHHGGMNCRLTNISKERKKSKVGIGWSPR